MRNKRIRMLPKKLIRNLNPKIGIMISVINEYVSKLLLALIK